MRDISFDRNCAQCIFGSRCVHCALAAGCRQRTSHHSRRRFARGGSGTITIASSDDTDPILMFATFNAKDVYKELRSTWNEAQLKTVVE